MKIPDSQDLLLTRSGKVISETTGKAVPFTDTDEIPRLKPKFDRVGREFLCLCYYARTVAGNRYRERMLSKIMIDLFKPQKYERIGKTHRVAYKDEDFRNVALDNLMIVPYDKIREIKSPHRSVRSKPSRKKRRRVRYEDLEDSSWMGSDDTYF